MEIGDHCGSMQENRRRVDEERQELQTLVSDISQMCIRDSIKTQGDEKELTLFTCSQKGTMRFVVRCIYKEAVMDE